MECRPFFINLSPPDSSKGSSDDGYYMRWINVNHIKEIQSSLDPIDPDGDDSIAGDGPSIVKLIDGTVIETADCASEILRDIEDPQYISRLWEK